MAAPDPRPRAVETPLPIHMIGPPPLDPELGFTTTDDTGWEPVPVTRTLFAGAIATASYGYLRLLVLRLGLHRNWRYDRRV